MEESIKSLPGYPPSSYEHIENGYYGSFLRWEEETTTVFSEWDLFIPLLGSVILQSGILPQ